MLTWSLALEAGRGSEAILYSSFAADSGPNGTSGCVSFGRRDANESSCSSIWDISALEQKILVFNAFASCNAACFSARRQSRIRSPI